LALVDRKIAVTGATGRSGQAVRTALAAAHVPSDKVRLLEQAGEEAIISEYAGQAMLIGNLEPEALADRDLVFLCGSAAESAGCLLWQRKAGSLFVDLSGAAATRGETPVVNLAVADAALTPAPATVAAPHAISYAISMLLAPIEREAGVAEAIAVIHRPAADFGETGLEELHKQTVSLLSFGEVPKGTIGRQIAFNIVPQSAIDEGGGGEPSLEDRLGSEIHRILGWTAPRATVRVLIASVFHGHAGMVHVKPGRKVSIKQVSEMLKGIKGVSVSVSARSAPSPVEIAERPERMVATITADGRDEGGFWVWFVAGDLPAHAAENAVEIAARVS
jgi:aspartate-semialdehyde dehydrogenase